MAEAAPPVETPASAKTETPAPAQEAPRPRRTAVRPQSETSRRPQTGSNREIREKIGEKIGENLNKLANEGVSDEKVKIKSHFRGKTKRELPPPPEEAEPAAKAPEPEKEKQESQIKKDVSAADEKPAAESSAPVAPSELSLPDAHRRSLKNFNWSDEEIDAGIKTGAPFFATAAAIHKQRASEVEAYVRAGQAGLKPPEAKPAPAPVQAGNAEQRVTASWTQIKAAYPGNEKLFDMIAAPQIESAKSEDARAHQQRAEMLQQQVHNFFSADGMKHYAEHYKDPAKRDEVINRAAYIVQGAASMNKSITVQEALQMAHDSVALPLAKETARKEIMDEVKARAATLTQQNQAGPSSKQGDGKSGKPLSRQEIIDRAGKRMKEAGLR